MTRDELLAAVTLERFGAPVRDVPRREWPSTTNDLLLAIALRRGEHLEHEQGAA